MTPIELLERSQHEFATRLDCVDLGQWAAATPCDEWDVHFLVAHVVGGNRFAVRVLAGDSAVSAIEHVMSQPQLGSDPSDDFRGTASAQTSAFINALRVDTLVDHPLGRITARRFLEFRIFDLTLHAWDLAVAIDASPRLDDALVAAVLEIVTRDGDGMGFDIAPLSHVSAQATAQDRLLDLTGRVPG